MTTYAVGITKELTGAANARGYLVAQPGSSVLVKQDGVACDVYADNEKTPMDNPVPTGVPPGTAGVDTLGNLLVFMDPGRNYTATVTVGSSVVTVPLPDISLDAEEPIPAGAVEEAMLSFGVATQAELDAGIATRAPATGIAQSAVTNLVSDLANKQATIPPGTYGPRSPTGMYTYNADDTLATSTENGITTTYTYNGDGTLASTVDSLGVTRTYTYVGANLTAVA